MRLCGRGEIWRDRFMGLILDHINGVADDNRLENLRIVCPNCNATLDTHWAGRIAFRASRGSARSAATSSLRNSRAAVLLTRLRTPVAWAERPAPGTPEGGAPALRPADGRVAGVQLVESRRSLRRLGQGSAQMGALVQGRRGATKGGVTGGPRERKTGKCGDLIGLPRRSNLVNLV